ncbi:hypothetical protein [Bordetella genomosp. 4]|uniref:Uncharacterized protein n=1 Tax=Bordetella genomosp. 4 TaxID=463044 RepID=A0A261UUN3_9BORD|nr:hypothetical protein [Bordetella genomosp. 4]OZI64613.1 hypothetical protein CAL20_02880 [Bordetella genomosp. 4]
MPQVIAIRSFDHDGLRRVGDQFDVSEKVAEQLEGKGLVKIEQGDGSVPESAKSPESASATEGDQKPKRARRRASTE